MVCKKNKKLLIISHPDWIFIVTLLLLIACSRAEMIESVTDDAVVAVINGNNVAVKDLRGEMNLLLRQFRVRDVNELTPEEKLILKTNGLNRIIQNVLLNMEADSNQIFLTRSEYKDALKDLQNGYQGDSFNKYLELEGISFEIWKSRVKNNMLLKKMIKEVVNSKIEVSIEEVKQYYDGHQIEFQKGEQVRSLHIMVESEGEIRNILRQLQSKNADFSMLAQMHSLGPESSVGGDLGYFESGQMPEEFDGVFDLKVGQISETIKTPYGHHLFMVIDKKPASQMSFDESSKIIYNILIREKQSRAFENFMVRLRHKSEIKIRHDVLAKIN